MADLYGQRARVQSAWGLLEAELARLRVLTERMQRTGTVPPEWPDRYESVIRAQLAFEREQTAYIEQLKRADDNTRLSSSEDTDG